MKYSEGAARPWRGKFENVVFDAGKKATFDGKLHLYLIIHYYILFSTREGAAECFGYNN